jgi:hypothetical protein
MKTTAHKTLTFLSGLALCTIAGLAALVLMGCDEIDQIADNASKRPPASSLMPPQIDTDPEAREHKPAPTPQANPPAQQTPAATLSPAAPAPENPPAAQSPAVPSQPAPAQPAPQTQGQPAAQEQPSGQTEMMTLGANTGVQGQGYGGGLITEPVHQFFSMRNLITWDQIKHDMDIWQAIHNRWPKDAQEFQKEILEPANIELPELPPGNRYVYNPKSGELLVARQTK